MRIPSICLIAFLAAAPAFSADATCTTVFAAAKKLLITPAHGYSTKTVAQSPNQPEQSEIIYSGGTSGAIFIKMKGRWIHSRMTAAQMLQQEEENIRDSKTSCRYLRDESVGGEAAAVYSTHSENDGIIGDATIWIGKSRGLPLKEEIDTDVGGGPSGKTHSSEHFDYSNVRPPDGVK